MAGGHDSAEGHGSSGGGGWAIFLIILLVIFLFFVLAAAPAFGPYANVEYFFRIAYECLRGACYGGSGELSQITAWLSHLWLWIIIIGYVLSLAALGIIVYCSVRIFQIREEEHHHLHTLVASPERTGGMHPRWEHIQTLMDGSTPSQWREAIIEADIMLDEVLGRAGFEGTGVGEKLRNIRESELHSLQEAGEAHGVRNKIAHSGSSFELSEIVKNRTMAKYEKVFRELGAV